MYSQLTDVEFSQSQPMPTFKRKRSYGSSSVVRKRARFSKLSKSTIPGSKSNRCIIPLCHDYDMPLTTDPVVAFAWDTGYYYVNGGAGVAITGASEVATVFDMARLMKVEMTLMPAANALDYNNQTIGTGVTNIPYVYHYIDYNDATTPSTVEAHTNATLKTELLDKVIRRTFYPRLEGSNGIIDVGVNRKNIFMHTATASTQKWNSVKIFIDMKTQVWTYGTCRVSFKLFFVCMSSKL